MVDVSIDSVQLQGADPTKRMSETIRLSLFSYGCCSFIQIIYQEEIITFIT